ncbi:MAG: type II secretion system protein M [Deltaproteobacteria bacterium]|nr:type II secretion system protein M [Deltaproteobacteria bacterium]
MKINRREKILLGAGIVILAALSYYLTVIYPASMRQEALARYIRLKEADLKKITCLKKEWDGFQGRYAEAEKILKERGEKFTLLSYLERISRQLGIESKIHYMKPLSFSNGPQSDIKPEGIEIKLEGIVTRELITFLQKIEYAGKLLNIKRIKIQRAAKSEEKYLNVTLQVQTYVFF